jgi:hypothetical protein
MRFQWYSIYKNKEDLHLIDRMQVGDIQPNAPMMIGADPQSLFAGNMVRAPMPEPVIQKEKDRTTGNKVRIAFYMTLFFILLNLKGTRRIINTVYHSFTSLPNEIMNESGSTTMKGMVVFASIFFVVALILLFRTE